MNDMTEEQEQLLEYYRGCTPMFRRKLMDYALNVWTESEGRRTLFEKTGVSPDSIETGRDEAMALYDLCDEFGRCEVEDSVEAICRDALNRKGGIDGHRVPGQE